MKTASTICILVLTYNEQLHLQRCLEPFAASGFDICIIDSESTDNTTEIATDYGARVLVNPFVTHSHQLNFAIKTLGAEYDWLLRIDADEVLETRDLSVIKHALLSAPATVTGFTFNRIIYFLGKPIRHGGIGGVKTLRAFRPKQSNCLLQNMDEKISTSGFIRHLDITISDISLISFAHWLSKHIAYAQKEAKDYSESYSNGSELVRKSKYHTNQSWLRRIFKVQGYYQLPPLIRPFIYFAYRYVLRLGFLDGLRGALFHLLQGLWYRLIVDVLILEPVFRSRTTPCHKAKGS
jgi:glycosyltransferase involved in cell wall biosynthesis